MKQCPNCHTALPNEARFCSTCGATQIPNLQEGGHGGIRWNGELLPSFLDFFWKRFAERIEAEQEATLLTQYKEQIFASNYRDTIQRRLNQLAEELSATDLEETNAKEQALQRLLHTSDDLLDFFFIMHAEDLNVIALPERILRYSTDSVEINGRNMALDFMAFDQEKDVVYTDFVKMPVKKLKNAAKNFLFSAEKELIWFIYDQTLLGSCKEGFAMTDQALYWKTGWQPAQKVFYSKLQSLRKEKEWLLINDIYFNVSPEVHTRMIWLLRKLGRLH